jgi:hypothetical protein
LRAKNPFPGNKTAGTWGRPSATKVRITGDISSVCMPAWRACLRTCTERVYINLQILCGKRGRGGCQRRNALGLQAKYPPSLSDLKKDDGWTVYWPLPGNAKVSEIISSIIT